MNPTPVRMALACLVLAWASGGAHAETSPWYLGISQTLTHDSNLYRVPGDQNLSAPYAKADTVSTTALLGGLDQQWSRQRLGATASLRNSRYDNNGHLNNTGYALNANLDWQTIERLSGRISLVSDQNLAQFNARDLTGQVVTQRNVVRTNQVDATARLGTVTRLTLEAGAGWRALDYSASEYDRYDNRQTYGSLGVRWNASPALQLGSALRHTRGSYPHFPAGDGSGSYNADTYRRTDLDLTARWSPSGATSVSARISPTQVRYDRDTARNLSSLTGMLSGDWQPGGRLRLSARLSHDNGQSSGTYSHFENNQYIGPGVVDYGRTTTSLQLSAAYELSAKVALNAAVGRAHRNLVDTRFVDNVVKSSAAGSDDTDTLSLGARWTPLRWALVGCDLKIDQRHAASALSWSYSSTSLGCYGQATLQ